MIGVWIIIVVLLYLWPRFQSQREQNLTAESILFQLGTVLFKGVGTRI